MSLQYDKLMDVAAVPTTVGATITNPSNAKTYIACILLHNTTTSAKTVTIYLVPNSSGALGTPTTIPHEIYQISIGPYETIDLETKYPIVLTSTNDAVFTVASASGVNITCLGTKDL